MCGEVGPNTRTKTRAGALWWGAEILKHLTFQLSSISTFKPAGKLKKAERGRGGGVNRGEQTRVTTNYKRRRFILPWGYTCLLVHVVVVGGAGSSILTVASRAWTRSWRALVCGLRSASAWGSAVPWSCPCTCRRVRLSRPVRCSVRSRGGSG